jgi:hypothetical protein
MHQGKLDAHQSLVVMLVLRRFSLGCAGTSDLAIRPHALNALHRIASLLYSTISECPQEFNEHIDLEKL